MEKDSFSDEILEGQISLLDFLDELNNKKEVDIRGLCDDGYCPVCHVALDDLIESCPYCGQLLDWNRWKRLQKEVTDETEK